MSVETPMRKPRLACNFWCVDWLFRDGDAGSRYRNPEAGQTWSGRGRQPAWIAGDKESHRISKSESPTQGQVAAFPLQQQTARYLAPDLLDVHVIDLFCDVEKYFERKKAAMLLLPWPPCSLWTTAWGQPILLRNNAGNFRNATKPFVLGTLKTLHFIGLKWHQLSAALPNILCDILASQNLLQNCA